MYYYMNLRYDHDQLVRAKLATHSYISAPEDNDLTRQVCLHDLRARMIPVRPYRVHFSRELIANPRLSDLQGPFNELVTCMQRGFPLAPFLSRLASRPKSKDYMLMHWGMHHAHLSLLSVLNEKGIVARADDLLFFRVDQGNIYLVNIVPHKEDHVFEKEELVHIVERNWPHLHGRFPRIRGTMKCFDPSEIKKLRKENINLGGLRIGRRIVTPALGATSSGNSMEGQVWAARVARDLCQLENLVQLHYTEWFPKSSSWIASIQLVGLKSDCYLLRDSSTGYIAEVHNTS